MDILRRARVININEINAGSEASKVHQALTGAARLSPLHFTLLNGLAVALWTFSCEMGEMGPNQSRTIACAA